MYKERSKPMYIVKQVIWALIIDFDITNNLPESE